RPGLRRRGDRHRRRRALRGVRPGRAGAVRRLPAGAPDRRGLVAPGPAGRRPCRRPERAAHRDRGPGRRPRRGRRPPPRAGRPRAGRRAGDAPGAACRTGARAPVTCPDGREAEPRRGRPRHRPQPPGAPRVRDQRAPRGRRRAGRERGEGPARARREHPRRLRAHRRRRGLARRAAHPRVLERSQGRPRAAPPTQAAAAPARDPAPHDRAHRARALADPAAPLLEGRAGEGRARARARAADARQAPRDRRARRAPRGGTGHAGRAALMPPRRTYSSGTPWEPVVGYARAVRVGRRVWVSGTTATAEDGSVVGAGDAYTQTIRTLANVERALLGVGATMADVVRTRIFVTDISRWEEI